MLERWTWSLGFVVGVSSCYLTGVSEESSLHSRAVRRWANFRARSVEDSLMSAAVEKTPGLEHPDPTYTVVVEAPCLH